jgi:cobalt transporter subunit CbtB
MTTTTNTVSLPMSRRLSAGLVLFAIGGAMLFAVGLSGMAAAHNTAHDTRHAIGFPCH